MIYELVFSATGRSRNVLDIFAAAWTEDKKVVDLSDTAFDRAEYNFTADDLCIVCTSVFEGRVPAPAADKLKKLDTALDGLRSKYGKDIIKRGSLMTSSDDYQKH